MGLKTIRLLIARLSIGLLAFVTASFAAVGIMAEPVWAEAVELSSPTAASDADDAMVEPEIALSASSAIVIETGRQRALFAKNENLKQNIPAAAKIMTALIACQRLPKETPITISQVAADADPAGGTPDRVELEAGSKYTLEYLLYRLIYYNSDAAALAIAEQISNVEKDFVVLMNSTAASLSLTDTLFANCTGQLISNNSAVQPISAEANNQQYTTTSDLAKLVYQAISVQLFSDIISESFAYIMLPDFRLVTMHNHLQSIWNSSEGKIKGAFYCESEGRSYTIAFGTVNKINIVAATADGEPEQSNIDLLALFAGCESFYESTPLVNANQAFSERTEETLDGEVFGLIFKQTVYYVHPINDTYLKDTYKYNSNGPFSRPIQSSLIAGQVIFELKDGTKIPADVVPDRQILSNISLLDSALKDLQKNSNLTVTLIFSGLLLLLILLLNVIIGIIRLLRLSRLIVLEKRSRR